MFAKVDKSVVAGLAKVNPPVEFDFPYDQWEDREITADGEWVDKVAPYVVGYCYNGKTAPNYTVMCLKPSGTFAFDASRTQFRLLKKHFGYQEERLTEGASTRDAWNVDRWLASSCAAVLRKLSANLHSYPPCEFDLHKKALAVEGKPVPKIPEKMTPAENMNLCVGWYKEDLLRMAYLFDQYDEEKCDEKNEHEFNLRLETDEDGMPVLAGTDEEKREADLHYEREGEIYSYRAKCLHTALKMLDVYAEHLWD